MEGILADLYPTFKIIVIGLLAWIFTASLSACGMKIGNSTVLGSTSFLREVNAGARPMMAHEEHTQGEKRQLNELINRRY